MLLQDLEFFLLGTSSCHLTQLFLLLSLQFGCLLPVLGLLLNLLFDLSVSLLSISVLCISLALDLDIGPLLSLLGLLYSLGNSLSTFVSLSIDVIGLFLLHLGELVDSLLLLYHFVESLKLKFFSAARAARTWSKAGLSDIVHTLVKMLSFTLSVLVLPVLGTLLADLQLDFNSVQL